MGKFIKHQEKFYNRYEYKAEVVASKIYDIHFLGLEKEDIVQDFKLKIWASIPEYIKKWKEFRNGGYKPVPLPYYIDRVLTNKKLDYMNKITKEKNFRGGDSSNYDFGSSYGSELSFHDLDNNEITIAGVDILVGLNSNEKSAFVDYLKGYTMEDIKTNHTNLRESNKMIRKHLDLIKTSHPDLINHFTSETLTHKIEME